MVSVCLWLSCAIVELPYGYPGSVIADIAKSRAEIEAGRLLVLSAALQVTIYRTAHVFRH